MLKNEKNFPFYLSGTGFLNYDKLNHMGKAVYAFFSILQQSGNKYFHLINRIVVTSQDRPESKDTLSAHDTEGKAVDIVIDPPQLMPYYFSILNALFNFNVLLGTFKLSDISAENLHIHVDIADKFFINRKGFEQPDQKAKLYHLLQIDNNNVDDILRIYGFNTLSTIQGFAELKNESKNLLVKYYSQNKKADISEFTNMPITDYMKQLYEWLKENSKQFENIVLYGKILIGLIGGFMVYSVFKKGKKLIA